MIVPVEYRQRRLRISLAERTGHCRSRSIASNPFRKQQTSTSTPDSSGPTASSARLNTLTRSQCGIGDLEHTIGARTGSCHVPVDADRRHQIAERKIRAQPLARLERLIADQRPSRCILALRSIASGDSASLMRTRVDPLSSAIDESWLRADAGRRTDRPCIRGGAARRAPHR